MDIVYRRATPTEVRAGLEQILSGGGGGGALRPKIDEFLQFADRRGIDLGQMWIADLNGAVVWAVLPVVSPGKSMLLMAPNNYTSTAALRPVATQLVENVCADAKSRGDTQLAQVLIDPHDQEPQEVFAAAGFTRLAELVYLQVNVRRRGARNSGPTLPAGLRWQTYSAATHDAFARAILASYQNSLDCPGLNGVRDIEDIIAGHKATGEFDPKLWFLLTQGDQPHGVLLLSRLPRVDTAELVYVGLAPEARGKGLGNVIMQHALDTLAREGLSRLSLAVDSTNTPALHLYYRHGMQRLGSRVAMLRILEA